jgi:predicted small metal-binding protein
MTKSFKCTDVGTQYDWSATADTQDNLMQKIVQHAKEHHGKIDIPVEKVQAAIKEQ